MVIVNIFEHLWVLLGLEYPSLISVCLGTLPGVLTLLWEQI